MKHAFKLIIVTTILIGLLSGCYPNGKKALPSNTQGVSSDAQGSTDATQPFVGKVSETVGDAEFNYEVKVDFPKALPKIKLKFKQIDGEKLKSVLLRDKTINPNADRPDWVYETTDRSVLAIADGWISFADGRVDDNRSNFVTIANYYNKFSRANDEELSSFSSEDAIARANKLLDELGVEKYGKPCVIAVSPEVGNAYLKEYGVATTNKDQSHDDYDLWGEDDGIYVLKYRENINGIDISSGNMMTPDGNRTIQGTDLSVYVKKDMILYLEIKSWYDVVSLNEETVDLIFDAGYASNALLEHYGKIPKLKRPVFFTECNLEYVPQSSENGELIFTPAWCFSGYQRRADSDYFEDCAEYYYAETGIRYGSV